MEPDKAWGGLSLSQQGPGLTLQSLFKTSPGPECWPSLQTAFSPSLPSPLCRKGKPFSIITSIVLRDYCIP